jgi:hypothetical protein
VRTLIVLVLLATAMPAAADIARPPLSRSAAGHLLPVPRILPFTPLPAPPLPLMEEQPGAILVRKVEGGMETLGKLDRDLSQACQAGLFRQAKASKMIAVAKKGVLGVAFGHGLNLVDPMKMADRSKVYYFQNASTSLCLVRVGDNWDARHASSR